MSGELTKVLNHSLSAADDSITSAQQEISVENSSQPIVVSPESLTVVQQKVKPVSDNFVLFKIDYIWGVGDIIWIPSWGISDFTIITRQACPSLRIT